MSEKEPERMSWQVDESDVPPLKHTFGRIVFWSLVFAGLMAAWWPRGPFDHVSDWRGALLLAGEAFLPAFFCLVVLTFLSWLLFGRH